MKVLTAIIVMASIFVFSNNSFVLADGIKNHSTQSGQAWLAGGARFAEIEDADTPLHNLAGAAMMEQGWHFHLSSLYIRQKTTLKNTSTGDKYTLTSKAIPPYAAVTCKKDKWAAFFTLSFPGGIAAGDMDKFPAFDAGAGLLSLNAQTLITAENQDMSIEGGVYAFTLGGAYQLNDNFSFGYGLRRVTHFQNMEGKADYIIAATGTRVGSTIVDYEIEGTGIGHSFGLDWKVSNKLNLGFRYDMEVSIEADADVNSNDNSGMATDGQKYDEDLPAVFNVGIKYQLSDAVIIDGVFNYYFQKGVDMMGGTSVTNNWNDAYDIGIGLSYMLSDKYKIRAGINYAYVGIPGDEYTLNHSLTTADNIKLGLGLEYTGFSKTKIIAGLGSSFYTDESTSCDPLGNHERESEYAIAFGMVIEYKL